MKKPVISWKPINLPGRNRKTFKIGKFEPKCVNISLTDQPFNLRMPKPVRVAFEKISDGFKKLTAFTKPLGEIAEALQELGVDLEPLQKQHAEAERKLGAATKAISAALDVLARIARVLKWLAWILGPWLVLSDVCWVWLRLARWRRLMVGQLA